MSKRDVSAAATRFYELMDRHTLSVDRVVLRGDILKELLVKVGKPDDWVESSALYQVAGEGIVRVVLEDEVS
jgi:hypothetical protein